MAKNRKGARFWQSKQQPKAEQSSEGGEERDLQLKGACVQVRACLGSWAVGRGQIGGGGGSSSALLHKIRTGGWDALQFQAQREFCNVAHGIGDTLASSRLPCTCSTGTVVGLFLQKIKNIISCLLY